MFRYGGCLGASMSMLIGIGGGMFTGEACWMFGRGGCLAETDVYRGAYREEHRGQG